MILIAAAVVLRWISRRVRFYRSMVLDPILARLWTGFGQPKRPELIVFPKANFGPFAAKSRLRLTRPNGAASGWVLEEANWWMPAKQHLIAGAKKASMRFGWVMHSVVVEHESDEVILSFSRRYDDETLRRLLSRIGVECEPNERVVNGKLASEFA